MLESKIIDLLRKAMTKRFGQVDSLKFHASGYTITGQPDLIVSIPCKKNSFFIETKAATNFSQAVDNIRPQQRARIKELACVFSRHVFLVWETGAAKYEKGEWKEMSWQGMFDDISNTD